MQEIRKLLKIGDKVCLQRLDRDDEHQHVSRIESINEDETIDVLIPMSKINFVYINNDADLKLSVTKEGAVYEFKVKIVDKLFGTVPLLRLMKVSEIKKIQRRNYYRLRTVQSIKVRKIISLKDKQFEEYFEASMVDISGGGIGFNADVELNIYDSIEVSLDINSNIRNIIGKIVRKEAKEDRNIRKFSYGVAFERITEADRNFIMKFIFEEQRKLAKKGLI